MEQSFKQIFCGGKMKKLLLVSLCAFGISSSSFANHGPAGCGLGSILFDGKEGIVFNVLAATFNASSGNQTFAMSTGTLGCEDAHTAKVSAVSFIEANQVALANDIARGDGETLAAYMQIANLGDADASKLQAHYAKIFAKGNNPETINNEILAAVR